MGFSFSAPSAAFVKFLLLVCFQFGGRGVLVHCGSGLYFPITWEVLAVSCASWPFILLLLGSVYSTGFTHFESFMSLSYRDYL